MSLQQTTLGCSSRESTKHSLCSLSYNSKSEADKRAEERLNPLNGDMNCRCTVDYAEEEWKGGEG